MKSEPKGKRRDSDSDSPKGENAMGRDGRCRRRVRHRDLEKGSVMGKDRVEERLQKSDKSRVQSPRYQRAFLPTCSYFRKAASSRHFSWAAHTDAATEWE